MVAAVFEDEEIFFDELSDPGWANNTPWYMTELISKDTTKELSPDSPENRNKNIIWINSKVKGSEMVWGADIVVIF